MEEKPALNDYALKRAEENLAYLSSQPSMSTAEMEAQAERILGHSIDTPPKRSSFTEHVNWIAPEHVKAYRPEEMEVPIAPMVCIAPYPVVRMTLEELKVELKLMASSTSD